MYSAIGATQPKEVAGKTIGVQSSNPILCIKKSGHENAALWALIVGGLTLTTFFGGLLAFAVYIWQRE